MNNTHSLSLVRASSQGVSITDHADLKPTGNFTIEAWVKMTTLTSGVNYNIFQSVNTVSAFAGFILSIDGNNKVLFETARGTGGTKGTDWNDVISAPAMVAGIWTHVAGVYNGSTIKVYINGFEVGSTNWTHSAGYNATNYVRAGIRTLNASNDNAFNGQIDEIRLWSDARSAIELKDNMFQDLTPGSDNLIDVWQLNNSLNSKSGSHNGTGINSPTFNTDVPFPEYTAVSPVALSSTTLGSDANLQGHWSLDDVLTDSSSNGNTLTNNNSATFASGKFNNGVDLESGSSQYLSIADGSQTGLDLTGDFTITAWIKLESVGILQKIVAKDADTGRSYALHITDTNKVGAEIFKSGGNSSVTGNSTLVADTLYHVAVTYDSISDGASVLSVYVDGILDARITNAVSPIINSSTAFTIGRRIYSGFENYFDGVIDDVGVFNRALTPTEIFELYTGLNLASSITKASGVQRSSIKKVSSIALANVGRISGVQ